MLKNYLKIALRNLRRHPGYAFINVAGLAVGIAGCLLILLYVRDELDFDRFHAKAERIYRIVEARQSPDKGSQHFVYTMGPLGPTLVEEFPEVEASVRMISRWSSGRMTVEHGNARFYSGDHLFAEPGFFDVFDFELLRGHPETALREPLTVILTETAARRYFGDEDPMGRTLTVERLGEVTVTGLLKDVPHNSHLNFSMLFSFATLEAFEGWNEWLQSWTSNGVMTYVVLAEDATAEAVEAGIQRLLDRHLDATVEAERHPYLQRLTEIHFGSAHIEFDENRAKGDVSYLYIFFAIAAFVLLIACINYMNMATARSMRRAREVGLRKVVGAHRLQLIRQFLSESLLLTLLALLVAVLVVQLTLPAFNSFTAKDLRLDLLANPALLGTLAVVALVVGTMAGSYPAFYLSRFRPARVLKGDTDAGTGAARLRRGLVVVQFSLSLIMIVATLVVYNQLQFVQSKRLGFNEDHLVVIDINDGDVRRDFRTVKQAFSEVPSVQSVAVSSRVPGDWKGITQIEAAPEGGPDDALTTMHFLGVDEDFLSTMEMELLEGRNFSANRPADSSTVLINETAARLLGWHEPIGKRLHVPEDEFVGEVIGVVRDFHFHSLHEEIGPLVLGYYNNPIRTIDYFAVRIDATDVPSTIDRLRRVGEQFDPEHPFEYNFLDERLNDYYEAEQRAGTLFGIAAGLAIFVACLGLFGLAAFTAERRTKEIGIRKVLGASVAGLVALMSTEFLKLVLIAFVVAVPVSYFVMERWLENFAYHVEVSWPTFVAAGLTVLLIALLTVSYQAIKTALTDPVKSLRYE